MRSPGAVLISFTLVPSPGSGKGPLTLQKCPMAAYAPCPTTAVTLLHVSVPESVPALHPQRAVCQHTSASTCAGTRASTAPHHACATPVQACAATRLRALTPTPAGLPAMHTRGHEMGTRAHTTGLLGQRPRWGPGWSLPLPALPASPRRPGATLPNPRAAEPGPRLRLRCPGRPGLGLAVGLLLPASPWDAGHAASPSSSKPTA